MQKINLKKYADKRLRTGHQWIFSNEIDNLPKHLPAGSLVEVIDDKGYNYGVAFFNPNTLISARLLNSTSEPDKNFYSERIKKAADYRKFLFPDQDNYRLVYAESDFLPGLIIDRYGDYFALQVLSAGIEKDIAYVIEALLENFPSTKGIIEKSKSVLRQIEGLPDKEEVLFGDIPETFEIIENGIKLKLNLITGQKTGYFLDQKVNRKYLQTISKDKTVLDCFCNQGGFALNAAYAGAKHSLGIDSSQEAINSSLENKAINNFTNVDFEKAEVMQYLQEAVNSGKKWDIIILDPPSFAKSRKNIPQAKHGYGKINRLAMQCLTSSGILVTSSCTHVVDEENFLEVISKESGKLRKNLRLMFRGNQSPCHPILQSMPETNYLKFFVFNVE